MIICIIVIVVVLILMYPEDEQQRVDAKLQIYDLTYNWKLQQTSNCMLGIRTQ